MLMISLQDNTGPEPQCGTRGLMLAGELFLWQKMGSQVLLIDCISVDSSYAWRRLTNCSFLP